MAAPNINVVVVTGNLTKDPELKSLQSGTSVCKLRLAVNARRKVGDSWEEKANYFDVVVWGKQGEAVATYCMKGKPIAVAGRLDWHEWEAKDGSGKRQAVEIVAESVQFLGGKNDGQQSPGAAPASDVPADTTDLDGAGQGGRRPSTVGSADGDDDIPF